ncbi:MAG: ABC transporter substrate-binding protein, partial [Bacilli bacterium]
FDVKDDGEGAYITDVDAAGTIKEVIAVSVNNSKTGQRYKPTLTAGPYQFVSFKDQIVIVEKNPNFKMNYEGKTPFFDEVVIKQIATETDVEQVIAGTVDIVSGVISAAKIASVENSTTADYVSYARNGYGLIAFAQYWGPTQYEEVRRAMAYLLDRRVFLDQFLGGYGTLVNGPYGEAQWFYKETKDELDDVLINYTLDIEKANEELDNSPYKFESDGTTPWDPAKAVEGTGYLRYNAEGEKLFINHFSASSEVGDIILLQYEQNAWQVGLEFQYQLGEFDTLLDHYYYGSTLSEDALTYHSFNLATNFYSDYDPYWSWHSSLAGSTNNPGMTEDDEIDRITEEMQKLDPTQKDEFKELFVEFVTRWNEILPNIPIYSNEYFDVHSTRITGLQSTPVWSWAKDICDIKLADAK